MRRTTDQGSTTTRPLGKRTRQALLPVLLLAGSSAQAEVSLSYAQSNTAKADPGNEIDQHVINFSATQPLHVSEDHHYLFSGGVVINNTRWDFDEPLLSEVDLLKIELPLTSTYLYSDGTVLVGTLMPGLHGETDDLGDADFRLEAQAMVLKGDTQSQWYFGLAYGDNFGKPVLFPVIGRKWRASESLDLNVGFPHISASYHATPKLNYLAALEPAGGQWSWKAGTRIGNQTTTETADLNLSAIRTTLGAEYQLSQGTWVSLKAGLEFGREIKLSRHSDPSINRTLELENAWYLQLGISLR